MDNVIKTILTLLVLASPIVDACEEVEVISCDNTDQVFITENNTHVVTSNISEKCRFVIPKEPGVCQMKLDLVIFELGDADAIGDCTADVMTISGSKTVKVLSVCGNLTGQHMYLDFGDSDKIELTIQGKSKNVAYDILATQLKCNHPNRAPVHCLQYFKSKEGSVRSFNYPRQQLNNQEYTVCVEAVSGVDAIQWRPCKEITGEPFFISGNSGKGKSLGAASGTQCYADYVQILGENRRCGSTFLPMTSFAKPFMLHVGFDASELPLLPLPPVLSLPVYFNRAENVNKPGFPGGPCPDMSSVGLVCTPPPVPCESHELGNRRGKEVTTCTCTAPAMNSDAMNTGFCLDFIQI
ncbi:unnamed protein product [Allacma fusca]|uniref:CUB domain-containing protein n=1 Tax=Allacma fusca TaxID=39272 RepID=A0A8J2L624_9HEXA|nr:unnamed protein product [Allacma fusca]